MDAATLRLLARRTGAAGQGRRLLAMAEILRRRFARQGDADRRCQTSNRSRLGAAVQRWQQRFAEVGVDGLLRDKTRKPGNVSIPAEAVARVVALICCSPPGAASDHRPANADGLGNLLHRPAPDGGEHDTRPLQALAWPLAARGDRF